MSYKFLDEGQILLVEIAIFKLQELKMVFFIVRQNITQHLNEVVLELKAKGSIHWHVEVFDLGLVDDDLLKETNGTGVVELRVPEVQNSKIHSTLAHCVAKSFDANQICRDPTNVQLYYFCLWKRLEKILDALVRDSKPFYW